MDLFAVGVLFLRTHSVIASIASRDGPLTMTIISGGAVGDRRLKDNSLMNTIVVRRFIRLSTFSAGKHPQGQ